MTDLCLGADIGGTKTAVVLCDAHGTIVEQVWAEHDPHRTESIAERLLPAVHRVLDHARVPVRAGAVAVSGLVSHDRRTITHAPTLGARDLPLAALLETETRLPFAVLNDANATLLGHFTGLPATEHRHVVLLTLGTGLGGAVAVDGRIVEGAHGFAGELGHVAVDYDDPRRCLCGAPGCVENFASGRGLAEMAAEAGLGDAGEAAAYASRRVVERAATDAAVRALVERAGRMLGRAVTQLSIVLDPDEFIIGGSVGHAAADILLPAARAEMQARWPFAGIRALPELRVDSIGPFAGAVGAAHFARQHHLEAHT